MSVCRAFPFRGAVCLVLCLSLFCEILHADEFLEGFDGPETSWLVAVGSPRCRVVDQRRHAQIKKYGKSSENIVFDTPQIATVELTHGLSPARVLDEALTATVWVRSNRSGALFSLRVVYPHLTDPKTGKIAYRWFEGESFTTNGKWHMLTCKIAPKELTRRNQLLRGQYGSKIDLHDAYVDRARLSIELAAGPEELFIDELKLSPVVSPSADTPIMPEDVPLAEQLPAFKMHHDRPLLNGHARYPTFLPYHGEPPEELANMGVNLVWIPRYDDHALIDSLTKAGIGVIATPPLAVSSDGTVLDADNAGLVPLGEEFDHISFWMLGNEIPASGKRRLANWQKQLLSADRRRQRPLMANVSSGERSFSRLVDMLGVNRTVHGTSLDYLHYRDWLADRQLAGRPGSFMWTWIDTEPAADLVARRQAQHLILPVIEPDQIRLQTYAAWTSGMRGLGYWSTQGLFHEGAGAAETRLMLKQLQFELGLFEPWLATGSPSGDEPKFQFVRGAKTPPQTMATARKPAITRIGHSVPDTVKQPMVKNSHVTATVIESEFGTLLLGTWFDDNSQFVPGQIAADDVQIVVSGIKETAKVWEVTTTDIRSLVTDRNHTPGGTLIRLPVFDSTAAIVISSDLSLGDDLRRRMRVIQAESATCIVQLARAKYQRVEAVIAELRTLGHAQPDSDRMLRKARQLADQGAKQLEQKEYDAARKNGDRSLQMLRVLQRAHWDDAVGTMSHPLSSPHTVCFQTLPDHWRMLARLKNSHLSVGGNLLHSGDFEDEDTFRTAGWQHTQSDLPGIIAVAELIQPPDRRGYSLRLAAAPAPDKSAPLIVASPPVTVVTPSVPVQTGQTVRIRGEVKVLRAITGTRDGFQISDSLTGTTSAIHWTQAGDWQRFELLREVPATATLTLQLTLHGMGEVIVDNLTVEPLDAP